MQKNDNFDEKVLELIDQLEISEAKSAEAGIPPKERTIYTGIKINERWIYFEERRFVGDRIAMMVPEDYKDLDESSIKIKYPSENRPQKILSDAAGSSNILFSYMDEPMKNDDAQTVRDGILEIMLRVNPGIKLQSTGLEVISDKNVAYIEFSNPTIDSKLYNLMFFMELDGKTLMGSFNCPTKSIKYWKNSAFEMMRSIRVLESGEKEQDEDG